MQSQQFGQSLLSHPNSNARLPPPLPTDSSSSNRNSTQWFLYERSDEISTRRDPIQKMQKNQTSSRIEDGGSMDRISEEEEVLRSGDIRAEKTGDLDNSDDDALQDGGAD
jgi:hypothetical protein